VATKALEDWLSICLTSQFRNCIAILAFVNMPIFHIVHRSPPFNSGTRDAYCGFGCQLPFGSCAENPALPAAATVVETQFPSLIILIAADQPNRAFGTQNAGTYVLALKSLLLIITRLTLF
jgi:hypothetical protein